MAERIRGITVQIGGDTKNLQTELSRVDKHSKSLQAELNKVNALLKLDPTNTELVAQKQQLLREAIEETKTKLEALKAAQEQVNQKFAAQEISGEQYRDFQRNIIATEQRLRGLENELNSVDSAAVSFGEQIDDSSLQLQAGQDAIETYESSVEKLKGTMLSMGKAAVGAVTGLVAAAQMVTSSTAEFRSDFSKLKQNAAQAGASINDVSEELKKLEALTGETDSSIEALSNLLKAGFTGDNLSQVVKELSGAVIQFPDTLKIESLSDSLQETLATSKATSQFGELLERLGYNLEVVDTRLGRCNTESEKMQYVMNLLARTGLSEVNEAYEKNNETLYATANAQYEMREAMAKIADEVAPHLAKATSMLAEKISNVSGEVLPALLSGFEWMIDNFDLIISGLAGISAAMITNKTVTVIMDTISAFQTLRQATQAATAAQNALNAAQKSNPLGLIIGLVAGLIGGLVTYAAMTKKAKSETEKLVESSENLKKELDDLKTSYNQNAKEIENEYKSVQLLSDSLYKLSGKENKTNEEKKKMSSLVRQLNNLLPDLHLNIDEETGLLSLQKEEVDNLIQSKKELLLVEAEEKSAKSAAENYVAAKDNLDELKKKQEQLTEEISTKKSELNKIKEDKWAALFNFTDTVSRDYEISKKEDKLEELNKEVRKAEQSVQESYKFYESKIDALTGLNTKTSDSFADTAKMLEQNNKRMTKITENLIEEYEKGIQKQNKEYEKGLNAKVNKISDSYDAQLKILKKNQKEELRQFNKTQEAETKKQQEEVEKRLEIEKEAYEEKLRLINEEYVEKFKLVDEEKYKQLREVQEKIDRLDADEKAEEAAAKAKENAEKKAELAARLEAAKTAEEKMECAKSLREFEEKLAEERLKTERALQREILEETKETIEAKVKAATEALEIEQKQEEEKAAAKYEQKKKEIEDNAEIEREKLEEKQYYDSLYFSERQEYVLENLQSEKKTAIETEREKNEELFEQFKELQQKKLKAAEQFYQEERINALSAMEDGTYNPSRYIVNWQDTITKKEEPAAINYDKLATALTSGLSSMAGMQISLNGQIVGKVINQNVERMIK